MNLIFNSSVRPGEGFNRTSTGTGTGIATNQSVTSSIDKGFPIMDLPHSRRRLLDFECDK